MAKGKKQESAKPTAPEAAQKKTRPLALWFAAAVLLALGMGAYFASNGLRAGTAGGTDATAGVGTPGAPTATPGATIAPETAPKISCGGGLGLRCPAGQACAFREIAPNATGVCKKKCEDGDFTELMCVGTFSGTLTYYECVGGAWESRALNEYEYCVAPPVGTGEEIASG